MGEAGPSAATGATEDAAASRRSAERNIAQQRHWYGEPLGDRVRRLIAAYNVSQTHLAEILGVSSPMLSQLMSGRRAKIGNPVVLARLVMLERWVLTPAVASGDPAQLRRIMEKVRNSQPTVGRGVLVDDHDEQAALRALRGLASPRELADAARAVDGRSAGLAALLRRAAQEE